MNYLPFSLPTPYIARTESRILRANPYSTMDTPAHKVTNEPGEEGSLKRSLYQASSRGNWDDARDLANRLAELDASGFWSEYGEELKQVEEERDELRSTAAKLATYLDELSAALEEYAYKAENGSCGSLSARSMKRRSGEIEEMLDGLDVNLGRTVIEE